MLRQARVVETMLDVVPPTEVDGGAEIPKGVVLGNAPHPKLPMASEAAMMMMERFKFRKSE